MGQAAGRWNTSQGYLGTVGRSPVNLTNYGLPSGIEKAKGS